MRAAHLGRRKLWLSPSKAATWLGAGFFMDPAQCGKFEVPKGSSEVQAPGKRAEVDLIQHQSTSVLNGNWTPNGVRLPVGVGVHIQRGSPISGHPRMCKKASATAHYKG